MSVNYCIVCNRLVSRDNNQCTCANRCKKCLGINCVCVVSVLSPNAPTVVNEQGGKQSHIPHSPTCLPPRVILDQSLILAKGKKKYGKGNWKHIPPSDHLDHALVHIFGYMVGDTQDNHLGHAICRLMMAHELLLEVNSVKGEME